MSQIRKAQILGVGILTPALTGLPHPAAARSVDIAAQTMVESVGIASHDAAIALLQESVFALSPAEKLKIGGGRIRLSEEATKPKTQNPQTRQVLDEKARRKHAVRPPKVLTSSTVCCPSAQCGLTNWKLAC
jgi:hypothetical protein